MNNDGHHFVYFYPWLTVTTSRENVPKMNEVARWKNVANNDVNLIHFARFFVVDLDTAPAAHVPTEIFMDAVSHTSPTNHELFFACVRHCVCILVFEIRLLEPLCLISKLKSCAFVDFLDDTFRDCFLLWITRLVVHIK